MSDAKQLSNGHDEHGPDAGPPDSASKNEQSAQQSQELASQIPGTAPGSCEIMTDSILDKDDGELDDEPNRDMPAYRPPPEGERWDDGALQDERTPQNADSDRDASSANEIQSIMEQFVTDTTGKAGADQLMSQRLDKAQPSYFPPRRSSRDPAPAQQAEGMQILTKIGTNDSERVRTPASSIFQPPPPSPDPETDLPFDFHRFLEQLRHRTADPVARFLRSFLLEFGKKQWMVHEQVKIIQDFLEFIAKKMALCEVWRTVSDAEFDNAREGMEKLVMNRLYSQTFSPAIPAPEPPTPTSAASGRRRETRRSQAKANAGRKGQHQEDVERDDVVAQKMRIYGWIQPEHLDVPGIKDKGKSFLNLAQQELLKINSYRAPRDKIICVLNCCKVIFGFLKSSACDQSADAFVPLLILTVLHARPEHLVSNVQYVLRFRNQDKLGGETGYYISSLLGVLTFVENLDRTNLVISDADFEAHVEAAVSAMTEGHTTDEAMLKPPLTPPISQHPNSTSPAAQLHLSEKSALSRPEVTPRNSSEAERVSPRRKATERLTEKGQSDSSASSPGEQTMATGLLRSFQRPLSTIGRLFSDDSSARAGGAGVATRTTRGVSPAPAQLGGHTAGLRKDDVRLAAGDERLDAEHDADEEQQIRAQEHRIVVETLQGMFPDLDKGVIGDVVRAKEGRVGEAVDACLALSN